MDQVNCICCDCTLEANGSDNPFVISPVYHGLIFRSNGNYGSTIFDPMVIGSQEMLQVIICDECIKIKAKLVTRLYNIEGEMISESEEFQPCK